MGINDPTFAYPGIPRDYYDTVQQLPTNRQSYPDPQKWKNEKGQGLSDDELAFVLKFIQRMQMEGKYSEPLSTGEEERERRKDKPYYERELGDV